MSILITLRSDFIPAMKMLDDGKAASDILWTFFEPDASPEVGTVGTSKALNAVNTYNMT